MAPGQSKVQKRQYRTAKSRRPSPSGCAAHTHTDCRPCALIYSRKMYGFIGSFWRSSFLSKGSHEPKINALGANNLSAMVHCRQVIRIAHFGLMMVILLQWKHVMVSNLWRYHPCQTRINTSRIFIGSIAFVVDRSSCRSREKPPERVRSWNPAERSREINSHPGADQPKDKKHAG